MIKLLRPFTFLILISAISFYPMSSVLADGENGIDKKDIDISLTPNDTLFNISNMKPGDWAPRSITVKNSGNNDFDYHMELQNKGDHKLFNELLLEVKAGDKELYQGKMAGFKSIPTRSLKSSKEESLELTIRFPEHLGNDFQGVQSEFVFTFSVKGKNSDSVQASTQGLIDSDSPIPVVLSELDTSSESSESGELGELNETSELGELSESNESNELGELGDLTESSELSGLKGTNSLGNLSPSNLPATSTNIFNLMLFGSALIVSGMVLMIVRHFRRIREAQESLK
ncbi:hypothetical protein ACFSFY_11155 [Sporosarcina siberiensis]|uniref:LPXTG-motif cell wall anchor domain-containing protein n=1 Tax=Sporosarcina siberiensis TaxID=1365606 RepID=A0ABW4SJB2_9BACL